MPATQDANRRGRMRVTAWSATWGPRLTLHRTVRRRGAGNHPRDRDRGGRDARTTAAASTDHSTDHSTDRGVAALAAVAVAGLVAACGVSPDIGPGRGAPRPSPSATSTTTSATTPGTAPATTPAPAPTDDTATPPPDWLGSRVLEPGPTGLAPPQPTPPELFPRSIDTHEMLPAPDTDAFAFAVEAVSSSVAARSTWHPGCPVGLGDLRHVTTTFVGFDGEPHTGELLVHADAVDAVREVFRVMYAARFPLEQVAITTPDDLAAPPTGDGNTTSAFVCRRTRGSGSWSAHAYGRALDVNPFQNPYVRDTDDGRVVLPELATAYTDRSLDLPGMLHEGGPVVAAIEEAGWSWGGGFSSLSDPMHASATGR
jgi:hypothetical protein